MAQPPLQGRVGGKAPGHSGKVCSQYDEEQGVLDLYHHSSRHREQIRQHGTRVLQTGRLPPSSDGIPQAKSGLLPEQDTDQESVSRRVERVSWWMCNLGTGIFMCQCRGRGLWHKEMVAGARDRNRCAQKGASIGCCSDQQGWERPSWWHR